MEVVSPEQIWSGDETGVQNVPKEIKVLGIKNIRTFQQVSSEQGETSTILSFVNALGNVVPPMIIHKGQRVQDTWKISVCRIHGKSRHLATFVFQQQQRVI